jgi:hypothetical protein
MEISSVARSDCSRFLVGVFGRVLAVMLVVFMLWFGVAVTVMVVLLGFAIVVVCVL